MVLRLAGSVLIISGSVGLGLWYREQFWQRLQNLRVLSDILEIMMSEVRYSKATLPECCQKLGMRMAEPYASVFSGVHEEMLENNGEDFGQIFSAHLDQCFKELSLGAEERGLFLQFAAECGYEDAKMQLASMEQYQERLDSLIARLESELAEKSRMAMGLGIMGGLLLVILLF